MKLSTFCKLCHRTHSWGYYQIEKGNLIVDESKPYKIKGISLCLYSDLKQKGVFDDVDNKEIDFIKDIIFSC